MLKMEFLSELEKRLMDVPEQERERALQFYAESIDDRKEEGLTEPEAVKALGNIDEIVSEILSGSGTDTSMRVKRRDDHRLWLILGSPIWFMMIAAGLGVWLLLVGMIWLCVLLYWMAGTLILSAILMALAGGFAAVWMLAVLLPVCGAVCVLVSLFKIPQGLWLTLLNLGGGMMGVGFGLLLRPVVMPVTRVLWKGLKAALPPVVRWLLRGTELAWKLCKGSFMAFKRVMIERKIG